jgi:hypothetical protein
MLTLEKQSAFNKSNDWVSAKNMLGHELSKAFNCVKGSWKQSRDGGAVGDYQLKGLDGVEAISLPEGAIVVSAFVRVKSAVTSLGALTLDLNIEAANDGLAAQALAGLTTGAKIQGIPDFGTLADSVVLTSEKKPSVSINAAAATAGEVDVYLFYVY